MDPTDLRRPPALPPDSAGFGTAAEKRLSISDTSNSGALEQRKATLVITKGRSRKQKVSKGRCIHVNKVKK